MQFFEYIDLLNQPYDIFITESTHCDPHWHYYCEILFLLEGTLSICSDGKQETLSCGDLCFIYPLQIHEICPAETQTARYAVLKFDIHALHLPHVYSTSLHSFFARPPLAADLCIPIYQNDWDSASIKTLILQTVQEYQQQKECYMLQVHANLSTLLIQILRNAPETARQKHSLITEKADFFYQIPEYIDTHSNTPLQVQELAELCHMSYSHFAKCFRETYGRSCKDYINYIRVNKAQEYLLHTNHDLNYIAMECGFFDCSHFIRTYKKWRGITPNQERIKSSQNINHPKTTS